MKTEREIIHQVKKLKYEAQRRGCGFQGRCRNPNAIGNPLDMITFKGQARLLEWVLEYEVPVKKINWYKKAVRIYNQSLKSDRG